MSKKLNNYVYVFIAYSENIYSRVEFWCIVRCKYVMVDHDLPGKANKRTNWKQKAKIGVILINTIIYVNLIS